MDKELYTVKEIVQESSKSMSSMYELINQSKILWDRGQEGLIPEPTYVNNVMKWTKEEKEIIKDRMDKPIKFTKQYGYQILKDKKNKLEEENIGLKELLRKINYKRTE